METNNKLTANDSIKIINEMIETAKGNIRQNVFYILLWGWIAFLGCTLHYIFLKFEIIKKHTWYG